MKLLLIIRISAGVSDLIHAEALRSAWPGVRADVVTWKFRRYGR